MQRQKLRHTTSAITLVITSITFERAAKQGTPTVYLLHSASLHPTMQLNKQSDMVREKYLHLEIYAVGQWCTFSSAAQLWVLKQYIKLIWVSAKVTPSGHKTRNYIHGYFT